MAIDPGTKGVGPAYIAAGLTTGAGAAAWSLSDVAEIAGIVASIVGIVCTVVMTVTFVRSQRRRTHEQREHHRKQREIQRGAPTPGDDGGD